MGGRVFLETLENIRIAAILLQEMFFELKSLAADSAALARTMAARDWALCHRLWTLHRTCELLLSVKDNSKAVTLARRATWLISSLSEEFDRLVLEATPGEYETMLATTVVH